MCSIKGFGAVPKEIGLDFVNFPRSLAMLFLGLWGLWAVMKNRAVDSPLMLKLMFWGIALPFIANIGYSMPYFDGTSTMLNCG